MKVSLKKNNSGFHYHDFGRETHGRTSFRLWVNKGLIVMENDEPTLIFPVKNSMVKRTEKGNFVLIPHEGITTYNEFVQCGYRGSSHIEVEGDIADVLNYDVFESPLGNLGVSSGKLISARNSIVIRWKKSGRLYGAPSEGVYRRHPNGDKDDLVDNEVIDLIK